MALLLRGLKTRRGTPTYFWPKRKELRPKGGNVLERTVLAGRPGTQVACLVGRPILSGSLHPRAVVLKTEAAWESPEGLLTTPHRLQPREAEHQQG